ncbi:unnamed protein product [Rhizoctonia solani]|uniref:Uncharacterized protein n=1 Tax=Rhizoctonia solani TaxID=456999 RepID=A0A8H3DDC8_9AGAM|nr:unnamed protein product [Rhizoctonia solani]
MGGNTKTEPGASPKVGFCGVLSDEVKAEVASLVQAALAKMQQPAYEHSIAKTVSPVVEISTVGVETEIEREYRETLSALEAKLSEANNQLENAYRDLGDARDQLEKQRAKSVQLEQRILQMSEAEGTLRSMFAACRADKDKAVARERDALFSRDRAGIHNAQISNQLSELQSELDLKNAQLNDATYVRQQLESRVNELSKENMSLRRATPAQGAPTGVPTQYGPTTNSSPQPPSNLYFSVPNAGAARRHTVPNVYPQGPASPTTPLNRPPKRPRADSDGSATSDDSRSRVSSANSMTFALRPVKLEQTESNPSMSAPTILPSNTDNPQYRAYSPVSPTAAVSPYYTQQSQQQIYAAPIPYQNQASYQSQSQGPSSAPPTMVTTPITRPPVPTMAPASVQMAQSAPSQRIPTVQQFINEIFFCTPAGFPECRICKVRPLGHATNGSSAPPSTTDLLAHAEIYHGRSLVPKSAQQPQARS